MFRKEWLCWAVVGLAVSLLGSSKGGAPPGFTLTSGGPSGQGAAGLRWESKARLRQRLTAMPGDLVLGEQGVEFHPRKGRQLTWSYTDIRTIALVTSRRFLLTSYENRGWHRPGDRQFVFELRTAVPPGVAASLVELVGKPAINGVPDPGVPTFAVLPARHRTSTGGSNGALRLRDGGMDYVASGGKDSRSWRWADIQTLAHPDPYRFRVGGYLETFDFELKQPMTPELFDRLWDHIYGRGLNLTPVRGEDSNEMDKKK